MQNRCNNIRKFRITSFIFINIFYFANVISHKVNMTPTAARGSYRPQCVKEFRVHTFYAGCKKLLSGIERGGANCTIHEVKDADKLKKFFVCSRELM